MKIYPIEKPILKGFFNCPDCKHKIPDIIVTCSHCGAKLNSNEKIRNLVKQLQEEEAKCKSINNRLKGMNLLFSKVVKWNYGKVFKFRKKDCSTINRIIHNWQEKKVKEIEHI